MAGLVGKAEKNETVACREKPVKKKSSSML